MGFIWQWVLYNILAGADSPAPVKSPGPVGLTITGRPGRPNHNGNRAGLEGTLKVEDCFNDPKEALGAALSLIADPEFCEATMCQILQIVAQPVGVELDEIERMGENEYYENNEEEKEENNLRQNHGDR